MLVSLQPDKHGTQTLTTYCLVRSMCFSLGWSGWYSLALCYWWFCPCTKRVSIPSSLILIKPFNVMQTHLTVFVLFSHTIRVVFRKTFSMPIAWNVLHTFSCHSFRVWDLTWTLNCFVVYGESYRFSFIVLNVDIQFCWWGLLVWGWLFLTLSLNVRWL